MVKKQLCIAAASLLAALSPLSLSACSTDPLPDPDKLNIMGKRSDLQKPYMTRIFQRYEESGQGELNIMAIEDAVYEAKAQDYFRKGKAPDIFLHFHNADLNSFDLGNTFAVLNGESWVDDLTDSARAYCSDGNANIIGLPFWESSVSGCYYNKTLLKEKGFEASATQEDFNGLCAALADLGQVPICWPAQCSWMMQFGLDPVFADDPELLASLNRNETGLDEIPAVKNMVQWIADAAEKGWFGEDYLDTGWDDISGKLSSGEAAMTFIWDSWFYTDFKAGKYSIDDFALMPAFLNTVPEGTYEGGNLNMMMVNKNSAKCDEALAFLSFCATPENYNAAFEGIATVSCFKGLTSNIQSKMVTEAQASISRKERVSTASTKIVGYSADDLAVLLSDLFRHKYSTAECLRKMNENRIMHAQEQGAAGF